MHRQQRFKKKEEGAAESSYSFSSTPVSMGTRAALCGLNKSPSPAPPPRPMCWGHCPGIVFVWPTLLPRSLSLPPSVPSNNTQCHRSKKKRRTHCTRAELNDEGQKCPGDWEPAFSPKDHDHHVVSGLIFYPFFKQVTTTTS